MIINNNFRLRLLDEDDIYFLKQIREDPDTQKFLGSFVLLSNSSQKKWFMELKDKSNTMFLVFENKQKDNWISVGYIRISDIDYINSSACVGGDIAKEFRGKGFAKEMYSLIFNLCFNSLNLNRLWLMVLDYNEVALNLYKKLGFKEEGIQREAVYKNGKYHDYIMMSLLRKDFKKEI